MDMEDMSRLYDARDTICEFCKMETSHCEDCVVQKILNDACNQVCEGDEKDEVG